MSDLNVFLLILLQYMQELATQEEQVVEEHSFTLNCFSVQVSASLRNPVDAWEVTPLDDGLVSTYKIDLITSVIYMKALQLQLLMLISLSLSHVRCSLFNPPFPCFYVYCENIHLSHSYIIFVSFYTHAVQLPPGCPVLRYP